ncbi:protein of unknown function [Modestobacter italicus]|uniref:Uncharacterized protein n=1 Tax=Modestobacter italicus (strain DSM 44449 / CECT 9708 / BC 501) TaxID=2732864 RepID=I4F4X0_MODI5|nr:protein of unknown function [Modestobacter marinus]
METSGRMSTHRVRIAGGELIAFAPNERLTRLEPGSGPRDCRIWAVAVSNNEGRDRPVVLANHRRFGDTVVRLHEEAARLRSSTASTEARTGGRQVSHRTTLSRKRTVPTAMV